VHYYAFNIGDYTSHTAHLSPSEDIAYRRLLDLYYQTESPISNDIKAVCRQIRMRDHEADVAIVLSEFFRLEGESWVSSRCDREIADYHSKADKARANGRRGGRPKKQDETKQEPRNNQAGSSSFHSANPDVTQSEPREKLTNKQEPITNNQEPRNTPPTPGGSARSTFPELEDFPDRPDVDDLPELHELPRNTGSNSHNMASAVCLIAKRMGIGLVNPGNTKLNALLNAGVQIGQFQEAIQKALQARKSFTYALAIVEREERDARALSDDLAKPKAVRLAPAVREQKSFAQQNLEAGWAQWEAMSGRPHPDRLASQPSEIIDVTARGDFQLLED